MIGYLPNLLIVGAAKAGTSSLHAYLDLHPQISMSKRKELELFNRPDDWRERLDWYRTNFLVRAPIRGESSPAYSMHPRFGDVPARMHDVIPNARIVYLVRDPIQRALAHYVEWRFLRVDTRSFEDAFANLDDASNYYVMSSRYAHQLRLYREHYPDERILVLDQRDLLKRRAETLRRVFRFLGVDEGFWTPEFEREHNVGQQKMLLNERGWWLADRNLYLPALRLAGALPAPVGRAGLRLIGEEIERPVPDEPMLHRLRDALRGDAEWLRSYTGEAFDHWSV
ncbi:MAG TPA: sulfotransferase [Thermoleophilaceae bacterium]